MSRLEPLDLDRLSPEQQLVADALLAGPIGAIRGPSEAWLRSPTFADLAWRMVAHTRYGTVLAPDVVELAILLTATFWRSQFEFWGHARLARKAGIPDDAIEAIRTGAPPQLNRPDLQAAYDVVSEHFATKRVSAATYTRAIDVLGEQGLVDLIAVTGTYGLVSMTLNVFEVDVPPGQERPFAD
ncbi:MAG: carboxymuconolactone decarboxylase family protein [Dehalococcoidia bacterium]|nr:carboxymuconolactone decarboxylase family protein [Dehalococcoidia bacterium]